MSSLQGFGRASALVVVCALGASCIEPTRPTGQAVPAVISDEVHGDGTVGFFFLPPMVALPTFALPFDPHRLSELRVQIDELGASPQTIATFTSTTGAGSELLRVDTSISAYVVNWHTDRFALNTALTYRIRIYRFEQELGFADVNLFSSRSELRNVQTNETIALRDGRTLPIQFRLSHGAPVGPAGAAIALVDGTVAVTFAPGAVDSNIVVTASPLPVASAPSLMPGTVFDFQPSPLFFDAPVTMSIAYPAQNRSDPSFLRLVRLVDGVAQPLASSRVDVATHTVSAEVTSFSDYAIEVDCPAAPTDYPTGQIKINDPAQGRAYTANRTLGIDEATRSADTCACLETFGNCDGESWNGCETDLYFSSAHCGGCRLANGVLPHTVAGAVCNWGRVECQSGWGDCNYDNADGCETPLVAGICP